MKKALLGFLAACSVAGTWAMSGCTSMRPVEAHGDTTDETIQVGDTVRVVTTDGRELIVKVSTLDGDALAGAKIPQGKISRETPEGTAVEIPRDQIRTLEVKRVDGWKTAGFIGGALAVSWLIGTLLTTALIIAL